MTRIEEPTPTVQNYRPHARVRLYTWLNPEPSPTDSTTSPTDSNRTSTSPKEEPMSGLTPARFESITCPTCKQPAGSPCVIKHRRRGNHWQTSYHIERQTRSRPRNT